MVVDPFGATLCEAGSTEMTMIIDIDPLSRRAYQADYHYLNERALKYAGEIVTEGTSAFLKIPQ